MTEEIKNKIVVKSNELIQKKRSDLSLRQQKILLLLIAQIQPNDDDFKEYEFSIKEFCNVCGLSIGGKEYEEIWREIVNITQIKIKDVRLSNGERTVLSWIEKPYYMEKEGRVRIRLDKDMKPFLLNLKENFTQYELFYTLCMKSKYSVRLYELICAAHYHPDEEYHHFYTLDDIRELLSVSGYELYKNLKARVLLPAFKEINAYTDKEVAFKERYRGRKIIGIDMHIKTKNVTEKMEIWKKIDDKLS